MTPDHLIRCDETVLRAGAAAPSEPRTDECLYHYLCHMLDEHGCSEGVAHTERWCDARAVPRRPVLTWARGTGGYCDCEILANSMGRPSLPREDLRCQAGYEEIYRRDDEDEWDPFPLVE